MMNRILGVSAPCNEKFDNNKHPLLAGLTRFFAFRVRLDLLLGFALFYGLRI